MRFSRNKKSKKSNKDVKLPDLFLEYMSKAPEGAEIIAISLTYSEPGVYNNAQFRLWLDGDLKIVDSIPYNFQLLDGDVVEKYIDTSGWEGRFYFRNYEHLLPDYLERKARGDVQMESAAQIRKREEGRKMLKNKK